MSLFKYIILGSGITVIIMRNANILIVDYGINGKGKTRWQIKDSHFTNVTMRNI